MIKKILLILMTSIFIIFQWFYLYKDISSEREFLYENYEKAKNKYEEGSLLKSLEYIENIKEPTYDSYILKAKIYRKLNEYSEFDKVINEAILLEKDRSEAYILSIEYYEERNLLREIYEILDKSENISSKKLDIYRRKYRDMFEIKKTDYSDISYPFIYKNRRFFNGKKDGKWSIVNKNGKNILPFIFDDIGIFSNEYELFPGRIGNNWSYYSINGEKYDQVSSNVKWLGPFDDLIVYEDNKGFSYMDNNFKKVRGYFSFASPFYNGLAVVKNREKYMVINKKFEVIIDDLRDIKLSDKMEILNNGLIVGKKDKWYLFNDKGEKISRGFDDLDIYNGDLISFKDKSLYGYINKEGDILIDKRFFYGESFNSNVALVKEGKKFKYIDRDLNELYSDFDYGESFNQYGYSFVKKGEYIYMIYLLEYEVKYENY